MASSPILLLLIMATIAIFGLMVASPCAAGNSLSSYRSLCSDQSLTMGDYALTMHPDCNLLLKDRGVTIWQTGTHRPGADCRLKLENNGNLVIYDFMDRMIWHTGKNEKIDNYALVLQPDRNLVVYGPSVWATYTNVYSVGLHNATSSIDAAAEQVIISAAGGAMVK